MNTGYVLGMDIGGTHIRLAMSRKPGEAEHFVKLPRESVLYGNDPGEALAALTEMYIKENGAGERPLALAAGYPATVDKGRRIVLQAPNIPGMDGFEATKILEEKLGFPVLTERDVNLLYYCDQEDLKLSREGVGIGIYAGTGIGNALFINGRPYYGKNGTAGELGHIPKAGSERVCSCGNEGCAECYASGRYLSELSKKSFPDTPLPELFLRHAQSAELREFTEELACVIAAEINILDPECIVLGGGVIHMRGFPRERLEARIRAHLRKPYPYETAEFFYSADAEENGVRGALNMAWAYVQS